jgi:ATP-dependent RNA helicase RhlE
MGDGLYFFPAKAVSGEARRRRLLLNATAANPCRIASIDARESSRDTAAAWLAGGQHEIFMTKTFSELGLSVRLVAALTKAGFNTPTPIQQRAIGPQLQGRDIMGIAQTGSGKTAAFGLPILAGLEELKGRANPMTTRALILAPTRELAVQIDEVLHKLADGTRLNTVLVLGGTSRNAQIQKIARGVDVVIATPGRLKDLVDDKKLNLRETRWLVLDEADRMLDMGFIGAVKQIAATIGPRRQTAMFSATMSDDIAKLAAGLLNEPVRVEAAPPSSTVPVIVQRAIFAGTKEKRDQLNTLLADAALSKVIVFSRTKHGADRVTKNLSIDGHEAAAIHGNKSQNARQAALKAFASGSVRILVATDIAARGIDVPNISHVINYELPDDPESYVHRIGRTGRNGATGTAITLVNGEERAKLREIERLIRRTLPLENAPKPGEAVDSAGAPAPRRGGQRPAAGHHRPANPRGAAPHKDGKPATRHEGGRATPGAAKAPGGKPRWNGKRKAAARTARGAGGPVRFGG